MKAKRVSRNISIALICVILGLALSWQFQSIRSNAKVMNLESQKKDDLVVKILNEQKNNENLRAKLNELQVQLNKFESARGNSDENLKLLTDEIQKLKTVAGLTDVKGKGVTVTFAKEDSLNVEDDDLLFVLNELRATDAQALAINDQRIIDTTEVRVAGGYIMVNGRHVTPPYVIKAIVDPDNAVNALNMIGGALEKIKLFIDVHVEKSDNIEIPKISEELIRTDKLKPVEKD
ncbi:DUF881 domain-containing protein [Ruminiclostridium cellobioparum]|jgi:uncharacterized protein YlxW (UPF0749 family)|uniref:Division initiation protein n=1 Tax=Ruminiclostridium cellobioparum subsp. termitidis CT1112 TaxID=1195236 RepID=S0FK76_RUMCE|nr:DUF881 domain-containing protein [Ruminiclostridium cellobioparum]EMS72227.1 hypothetical protein CTER_1833 [Ruminiclostridium cellobioparum subsp. termitidis CT1112]